MVHPAWTPAAADWLERCHGIGATERIFAGLVVGAALDMSFRAPISPLELALKVYRELQFLSPREFLRWHWRLERTNAAIIEQHRQVFLRRLEESRAAAPTRTAARGTRRPRSKRKKAGRR